MKGGNWGLCHFQGLTRIVKPPWMKHQTEKTYLPGASLYISSSLEKDKLTDCLCFTRKVCSPSIRVGPLAFLAASLTVLLSHDKQTFKCCYLLARRRDGHKGPPAALPMHLCERTNRWFWAEIDFQCISKIQPQEVGQASTPSLSLSRKVFQGQHQIEVEEGEKRVSLHHLKAVQCPNPPFTYECLSYFIPALKKKKKSNPS